MSGRVRLLAGASETSGQFALIEIAAVRGDGPPRHRHDAENEAIYVLDGTLTVAVDDHVRQVRQCECIVFPRGRDHTYKVDSDEARLLIVFAPAGLEATYLDGVWHADDLERLIAVAARYGIDVTGPPVGETDGAADG
jgi:quercetin dioxygenase-like cupin family protein